MVYNVYMLTNYFDQDVHTCYRDVCVYIVTILLSCLIIMLLTFFHSCVKNRINAKGTYFQAYLGMF